MEISYCGKRLHWIEHRAYDDAKSCNDFLRTSRLFKEDPQHALWHCAKINLIDQDARWPTIHSLGSGQRLGNFTQPSLSASDVVCDKSLRKSLTLPRKPCVVRGKLEWEADWVAVPKQLHPSSNLRIPAVPVQQLVEDMLHTLDDGSVSVGSFPPRMRKRTKVELLESASSWILIGTGQSLPLPVATPATQTSVADEAKALREKLMRLSVARHLESSLDSQLHMVRMSICI
jgi:hypothetical protein